MDTDELIADTMRRVAASAVPPAHDTLTRAPAHRWFVPTLAAAAAVALVVAFAVTTGPGDSGGDPAGNPTASASTPTTAGCRLDYPAKPLPEWARAGFTPPTQGVPHVLGDRGDIVAVVWAEHHPLVSPPADQGNKILWVARVGASDGPLEIRATLTGTGQTVTRTVAPAPGPSGIDLPSAGCWSLDLRWGEHEDHLVLGYAAR